MMAQKGSAPVRKKVKRILSDDEDEMSGDEEGKAIASSLQTPLSEKEPHGASLKSGSSPLDKNSFSDKAKPADTNRVNAASNKPPSGLINTSTPGTYAGSSSIRGNPTIPPKKSATLTSEHSTKSAKPVSNAAAPRSKGHSGSNTIPSDRSAESSSSASASGESDSSDSESSSSASSESESEDTGSRQSDSNSREEDDEEYDEDDNHDEDEYEEDEEEEEQPRSKKKKAAPSRPSAASALPREDRTRRAVALGLRERRPAITYDDSAEEDLDEDGDVEMEDVWEDEDEDDTSRRRSRASTKPASLASRRPAKKSKLKLDNLSDFYPPRRSNRVTKRMNYAEAGGEDWMDLDEDEEMADYTGTAKSSGKKKGRAKDDEAEGYAATGAVIPLLSDLLASGKPSLENGDVIEKIVAVRDKKSDDASAPDEQEYLIKWKNRSYLHVTWVPAKVIEAERYGKTKIQTFYRKLVREGGAGSGANEENELESGQPFNPSFVEVDRILDEAQVGTDAENRPIMYYLVKWCDLPYSDATWERAEDLNDDAKIAEYRRNNTPPPRGASRAPRRPSPEEWQQMVESPVYKGGNTLRPYQLEGVNWLVFCWYNGRNAILADEMGLGKTVQTVCTLHYLYTRLNNRGPFLVIAPLSTIPHWVREFEGWTDMNAIIYHGSAESRQLIREFEFHYRDRNRNPIELSMYKFNVLITTYEMILTDRAVLSKIPWRYCVIDEAHRLKNKDARLTSELREFQFDRLLLLTGTPLQNNTEELWSLLNFLEPEKFSSLENFLRDFGDLQKTEQVERLHEVLRPYLLRRMKEHVEKSIAPKEETIVEVELTNIQKKYYRAIYERNFSFLKKGCKGSNVPNLINLMMELRKCCNHPYLTKGAEAAVIAEYGVKSAEDSAQLLIKSSGKLVLIDKLLPKLKAGGHKVLIFSQMVRVLDILEDYLNYRGYKYERIDGRVRGNDRQAAIDRFSKPGSDRFVFLLCTKAGGLGINLTAADTVIIYDSDWNPQNDLQAQARCHRIGQTQFVKVYRLITRNTYEREMFERASRKLGLEQAVMSKMGTKDVATMKDGSGEKVALDKKEIDALLKYGAYDVFREDPNAPPPISYDDEDIDKILERSSTVIKSEAENASERAKALASFSKASFCSSETANREVDINDPDFWLKIIPEHVRSAPDPRIQYAPRRRTKVQRFVDEVNGRGDSESDEADAEAGAGGESDYDEAGEGAEGEGGEKRRVWFTSERTRLKGVLLALGVGRWELVRQLARLTRWSADDVRRYTIAMLTKAIHVMDKDANVEEWLKRLDNDDEQFAALPVKSEEQPTTTTSTTTTTAAAATTASTTTTSTTITAPTTTTAPTATNAATAEVKPEPPATVTIPSAEVKQELPEAPTGSSATPVPSTIPATEPLTAPAEGKTEQGPPAAATPATATTTAIAAPSTTGETASSGTTPSEKRVLSFDHDPTLTDPKFVQYLERNAKKLLRRLETLAIIGDYVRNYGSKNPVEDLQVPDSVRGAPLIGDGGSYPWWGEREDRHLVLGSYWHGAGRYQQIRDDPRLCFHIRKWSRAAEVDGETGMADNGASAKSEAAKLSEKAPESETVKTEQKPGDEGASSEEVFEWPSARLLNQRLLRFVRGVEQIRRRSGRSTRGRDDVDLVVDWSRRERAEFYKALVTFGVPVDSQGKYMWGFIREKANLKRKSEDMIERYYVEFLTKCRNVISKRHTEGAADSSEAGKQSEESSKSEDISYTQCKRVVQRIMMFSSLRMKVLKRPDLPRLLKRMHRSNILPAWWKRGTHDLALLRGIDRHGVGNWEELMRDPDLPFSSIVAEKEKERAEKEKEREEGEIVEGANEEARSAVTPSTTTTSTATTTTTAEGEKADKDDKKKVKHKVLELLDISSEKILLKRIESLIKMTATAPSPTDDKHHRGTKVETSKASKQSTLPFSFKKRKRDDDSVSPSKDTDKDDTKSERRQKRRRTDSVDSADSDEGESTATAGAGDGDGKADVSAKKPSKKRKRRGEAGEGGEGAPAKTTSRFAQKVATDASGNPVVPITLGVLTVESLGTVVYDRAAFHNDRYIWPVGFRSCRFYASVNDPNKRCKYTCEILDGKEAPIFRVTPEDDPEHPVEAPSATAAWSAILKRVNERKTEDTGKRLFTAVSGPEYFGFANPTIARLIQELPNADKCMRYKKQTILLKGEKDPAASTEGSGGGEDPASHPTKRRRTNAAKHVDDSADPIVDASTFDTDTAGRSTASKPTPMDTTTTTATTAASATTAPKMQVKSAGKTSFTISGSTSTATSPASIAHQHAPPKTTATKFHLLEPATAMATSVAYRGPSSASMYHSLQGTTAALSSASSHSAKAPPAASTFSPSRHSVSHHSSSSGHGSSHHHPSPSSSSSSSSSSHHHHHSSSSSHHGHSSHSTHSSHSGHSSHHGHSHHSSGSYSSSSHSSSHHHHHHSSSSSGSTSKHGGTTSTSPSSVPADKKLKQQQLNFSSPPAAIATPTPAPASSPSAPRSSAADKPEPTPAAASASGTQQ